MLVTATISSKSIKKIRVLHSLNTYMHQARSKLVSLTNASLYHHSVLLSPPVVPELLALSSGPPLSICLTSLISSLVSLLISRLSRTLVRSPLSITGEVYDERVKIVIASKNPQRDHECRNKNPASSCDHTNLASSLVVRRSTTRTQPRCHLQQR